MKKKTGMLYIFIVILALLIISVVLVVTINKSNNNIDNKSNNEENNTVIESWTYIKHEFHNGNGSIEESPFTLTPFTIMFREKTVDICYEECYTTNYTKKNNILTIDDFDYFSGVFEVSYEGDQMLLKEQYTDTDAYIMYYFQKPAG